MRHGAWKALALIGALGGVAYAAAELRPAPQPVPLASQSVQVGSLSRLTPDTLVVTLPGQGQIHLRVSDQTQVTLNGTPAPLNRLQPGQQLKVTFAPGEQVPFAERIDAKTTQTP